MDEDGRGLSSDRCTRLVSATVRRRLDPAIRAAFASRLQRIVDRYCLASEPIDEQAKAEWEAVSRLDDAARFLRVAMDGYTGAVSHRTQDAGTKERAATVGRMAAPLRHLQEMTERERDEFDALYNPDEPKARKPALRRLVREMMGLKAELDGCVVAELKVSPSDDVRTTVGFIMGTLAFLHEQKEGPTPRTIAEDYAAPIRNAARETYGTRTAQTSRTRVDRTERRGA